MNRLTCLLLFSIVVIPFCLRAQVQNVKVKSPDIRYFAPTLQFLASTGLEGRETGTQGATIAADYIASRMQNMGLKPYNNENNSAYELSDYFQPFKLLRCTPDKSYIEISLSSNKSSQLRFNINSDFKATNIFQPLKLESGLVFAGYGIVSPELGYNDYSGLDVKGKIVLIMEGYPGQHDSTSVAWKKFKILAEEDDYDLDKKCMEAANQGAAAIITLNKSFLASEPGNLRQKNVAQVKNPEYVSAEYVLPSNSNKSRLGCFRLNRNSSEKIAVWFGLDFRKTEQQIAQQLNFERIELHDIIHLSALATIDTITVNNVIGMLPGKDNSQTVIIGAHYDHLGKRGNTVYYGSDDNASGVAGLLALAEVWTESHTIPPYNILFASWTAEEKGLLGSEYFVSTLKVPEKVKLYINMDMISRSVKEDTAGRMLSIGTRTSDEYLRDLSRRNNLSLDKPFSLDLWDVTGHSGSDYANFMTKNIPVMTYNTGLHDDYHTPRDIPANADLIKMGDVLKIVNSILQEIPGKEGE